MTANANETLRSRLDGALATYDRSGAVRFALDAVASDAVSMPELYALLGELMSDVGARWQAGTAAVWEEHLASATVRTIVEALYPTVQRLASAASGGRTVVLACPENEAHDLRLRMLSDRFDLAGWRTLYLGADTPAGDIAAAAETVGAELIVLSVSTHLQRTRLRETLETLRPTVPQVRVSVAQPAFSHDHPQTLGDLLFDPEEFFGTTAGPHATRSED
jgi:methanogenic corrinoid protein MtbC1